MRSLQCSTGPVVAVVLQVEQMLKREMIEKLDKNYGKDDFIEKVISQFQFQVWRLISTTFVLQYDDIL